MPACLHAKSLQSCPTVCNPTDCSPPGSSVHGIPRLEYWSSFLLQGIFPTQRLNPGLQRCRWILYRLCACLFSHNSILYVNLCDRYSKDTEKPHPKDPSCCPVIAKATSFPSPTLLPGDHSSVLMSIIVSCQERHINRPTQRVYPLRLVFFPLSMIPLGSFLVVWVPSWVLFLLPSRIPEYSHDPTF